MHQPASTKIAYLFGAGATHAELINFEPTAIEKEEERGLLIRNVSTRVIEKARRDPEYLKDVEMVSGTSGSLDIELLISLIENSKIQGWESKTQRLKSLVREDIESILTTGMTPHFYLHKALFEFHKQESVKPQEQLIGLISLNWDDVLDQAYEELYGPPDYSFSLEQDTPSSRSIPLLKLHGSFNWNRREIRGRTRNIEIIPLGSNKNYLHAPYSFIWNRALEVLIECDTLRVVGCSLSQNDSHLVDLLFKAHLEKGKEFDIEIIASDAEGDRIQKNYGFFPRIKRLTQLEDILFPTESPENPFKTWLKYKSNRMLKGRLEGTRYLERVTA